MLAQIYQKNVIEKPKFIFFLLICFLLTFTYYSKDFRLDASSETLLLENDPDLKYLNEINDRYGTKEFLVLTYSPDSKMNSEDSIKILSELKSKQGLLFCAQFNLNKDLCKLFGGLGYNIYLHTDLYYFYQNF